MPESVGKLLAMCGVIVPALSITPTGGCIDPDDVWWVSQWKWIQRTLRQGPHATPVTINPILLSLGMVLSVIGIALSERGRGARWRYEARTRAQLREEQA